MLKILLRDDFNKIIFILFNIIAPDSDNILKG
jgi:hypothetical protein